MKKLIVIVILGALLTACGPGSRYSIGKACGSTASDVTGDIACEAAREARKAHIDRRAAHRKTKIEYKRMRLELKTLEMKRKIDQLEEK